MTTQPPHKQDEGTGLRHEYQPLCLQHIHEVEDTIHFCDRGLDTVAIHTGYIIMKNFFSPSSHQISWHVHFYSQLIGSV